MNHDEIKNLAKAAAKNIKTEADLNKFRQMLTKITVETALNAELDDHLGTPSMTRQAPLTAVMGALGRHLKPMTVNFK